MLFLLSYVLLKVQYLFQPQCYEWHDHKSDCIWFVVKLLNKKNDCSLQDCKNNTDQFWYILDWIHFLYLQNAWAFFITAPKAKLKKHNLEMQTM